MEHSQSLTQISFRQKGLATTGKLKLGHPNQTKSIPSSIPAKFKTTLLKNDSQKAFGTTTQRFTKGLDQDDPDHPGPGSYLSTNDNSMLSMYKSQNSFSKRGFGNGFASTDERKTFTYVRYINSGPGPQSYQQDSVQQFGYQQPQYKSITNGSQSFKTIPRFENKMNQQEIIQMEEPAPNQYNPKDKITKRSTYAQQAAFKSMAIRKLYQMKPFIVPDQGTYEVTKNLVQHKPYQANMEDRMFLKHDPFVKKVSKEKELLKFLSKDDDVQVVNEEQTDDKTKQIERNTSPFKIGDQTKFGVYIGYKMKPDEEPFPGPGQYETQLWKSIEYPNRDIQDATGYVFVSESERNLFEKQMDYQLGPNPILPKLPSKKSFILNIEQKWIQ